MSGDVKLKGTDRQRNVVYFNVTDQEYEDIQQIVKESRHATRSEWIRAALEEYAGKKIFRERREYMNRRTRVR